ncbi:hypothetical protein GZH53_17720 [Flavihumibacter sp. R14]|nr:hypothetical protein [Flavihumibacter soli]
MKRIIMMFFAVIAITACNTEKKSDAKEDSIAAQAAADSMLNEALKTDSLHSDTDSLNSDTGSL